MDSGFRRVTVIGDGAMGTLCARILADNGCDVRLWSNFPRQADDIRTHRENRRFLPGVSLPASIDVTSETAGAFDGSDVIISAVPCQFIRATWSRLVVNCPSDVPIVSVTKGIEVSTLRLPTRILTDVLGERPTVVLSGPSIATELAAGQPCTIVAACDDESLAEKVQHAFSNNYLRVYTNPDRLGVELAGATKNVIALAAGIIDGLGLGCNAKAALLTRGLVEIARLGETMGARIETFHGLTGVGDLVTTCISPVGRNRSAGERIGRGMDTEDVIASTESVIEGIPTTGAVLELAAKHNVDMPITAAVAEVLAGREAPADAIAQLMTRQLKSE